MATVRGVVKMMNGNSVLQGIDLDLPCGSITGLVGPNGSGKSTFARILGGLIRHDAGCVFTQDLGRPVLVQQDFVVWPHLTTMENVRIAARSSPLAATFDLMHRFHLADLSEQKAGNLSFGQQQRLCLARAFSTDASFFIFDECLSGADTTSRCSLMTSIVELLAERQATALWISHDWNEVASICASVAIIQSGKVAQIGPPDLLYWSPRNSAVARITGPVTFVEPVHIHLFMEVAEHFSDLPGATLAIRPETIRLSSMPSRTTFRHCRSWRSYPGFIQEIQCANGFQFQRYSMLSTDVPPAGSIHLDRPPCVLC